MTSRYRSLAWLVATVLATTSSRSPGQEVPLYRDPSPTEGPRVQGPLLPARPSRPDPVPAPPSSGLGPFQPEGAGTGPPVVPPAGQEPVELPREPLLIIPPMPPPLPMMAVPPTIVGDGVEIRRKTTIRGPKGVLGQCHEWFRENLFGPHRSNPPAAPRRGLFATIFHHDPPAGEAPSRFLGWPSWPSWPLRSGE